MDYLEIDEKMKDVVFQNEATVRKRYWKWATHFLELVQTERQWPRWNICSRPDSGLRPSTSRSAGSGTATAGCDESRTMRASAVPWNNTSFNRSNI